MNSNNLACLSEDERRDIEASKTALYFLWRIAQERQGKIFKKPPITPKYLADYWLTIDPKLAERIRFLMNANRDAFLPKNKN